MPVKEREQWKDLSNGISEYYNSPGRLAVFRRRFESVSRRPGVDPATFATELGILAVRGFGDMGKRARDLMVRNKFIAAQQSFGLRRYLDGVSSDAPIREIVDSCRVWESHSDREPSPKVDGGCNSLGVSGESCTVGCLRTEMQELPACSGMDSRVPGTMVGVDLRSEETPRKVEEGDGQLASLETISSLVTQLLRTVQEGRRVDDTPLPEGESGPLSAVSLGPGMGIGPPVREWTRVCFSCGRQGHGVNRCSQMDTSFPFLPPGWSADVRNGQYRVSQTDVTGLRSTPGNEGWSGREGQPPGPSGIEVRLTPAGEGGGVRKDASRLGRGRWGVSSDLTGLQMNRDPNGAGLYFGDGRRSSASGSPGAWSKHMRGMWPAGEGRPLPQQTIVDLTKEGENAAVRPLSVEAAEFSLRPGPRTRVTAGADSDGGGGGGGYSPPSHLDSNSSCTR